MSTTPNVEPIVTAIALSLYRYNVSAGVRAQKLYDHFEGHCMELVDLTNLLLNHGAYDATELPFPTADIYVRHAIERYGDEAARRVTAERSFE